MAVSRIGYQRELVTESGVDGFGRYVCRRRNRANGRGSEALRSKQFRRRLQDRLPGPFSFVGSTGTSTALALDFVHTHTIQCNCINTA
jgi:hypothetical protein